MSIQRNYTNTAIVYFRLIQLFFTCETGFDFVGSRKNEKKGTYQLAPPSCNFAYTRAIKGDIGFQDPFVAFFKSTKVTGNRLFEAWE